MLGVMWGEVTGVIRLAGEGQTSFGKSGDEEGTLQ